jgi:parvulin-like peptidyl-prolyl isomerase
MAIRVNGERIPEQAVLTELKRLIDFYSQHLPREELGRQMATLVERAKEHAVGTKLLLDEVKRRHVEVPDAEVNASLDAMAKKAGGDAALDELLARQQISRDQLCASIRAGKQLDRLIARVTAAEAEPTEAQLLAHYEENAERYLSPDQAQVRHILIKPAGASKEDQATVRSRLEALKGKIEEGEDFGELAAAFSECPSGKETGGSLGWVARGTTVEDFDRAIFDMQVGDISDIIETALGFHLIEKLDEELGGPIAFPEVRDRIHDLLLHERRGHALTEFVKTLRAAAVIDEDEKDEAAPDWERLLTPDKPDGATP